MTVEFDDVWDRQIEVDAKAGRLEKLWQAALKDEENVQRSTLNVQR